MYSPAAFAEPRLDVQHALMRAHPLGTLIVAAAGAVTADLVPFQLYAADGPRGTLRAHVARANPVWQALCDGAACLVVFQGPQAYVSPGWYATKAQHHKVVPTWNYAVVQVRGTARVVEDAQWLRRQLSDLTAAQEGALPQPWAVTDAPAPFVDGLLAALVGIELAIDSIEGKWKVSQNRVAADRAGVAAGLAERGALAMADLVRERGPA
ncbi:FMN-binding negative transcriptional regulator [Pseudoduganella armeniaca]|uniref:Transcriptional regulator n=1 Tax=Pseudoduganella armeniaca TaxID=2072590 RepID=A0A2R4CAA6_9BURK|nr:FMN-binding negative transcriptional regulator [Pseudoduganella armeniaca]AVR96533.1 transcriptional regulator [Pseudoduganella armeniaca]